MKLGTRVIINDPTTLTHGKEGIIDGIPTGEPKHWSDNRKISVSFEDGWGGYYWFHQLIPATELGKAIYE